MTIPIPDKNNPLIGTIVICHFCNKEQELHWNKETNERLVRDQVCFTCNHFIENEEFDQSSKGKDRWFIAEHVHYRIGDEKENPTNRWRGFGGSKFRIRFFSDGRIVESTNVWCQGHIPYHFYQRMPDTAEILPEKPYEFKRINRV